MPYALMQKLRDAGWPQHADKHGSYYALPVGSVFLTEDWRSDLAQPQIPCRIPTLEELIEACGVYFFKLIKQENEQWYAGDEINKSYAYGSTPSEAVANLWLTFHQSKA